MSPFVGVLLRAVAWEGGDLDLGLSSGEPGGGLVPGRGDTAVVGQATDHDLDAPALGVAGAVVLNGALAIAPAQDDRPSGDRFEIAAQAAGAVAAVGHEALQSFSGPDERGCGLDVGGVGWSQRGPDGPAEEFADGEILMVRPPRLIPMACISAPRLRRQPSGEL